MTVNTATFDLTKRCESLQLKAYLCPAGVPTIGYGHTANVSLADVARGRTCTLADAQNWLEGDLADAERAVLKVCAVQPNDNQLGAMTSMAFNVGITAFEKSTVLRCHNRGDFNAAAQAFSLFNKATVNGRLVVEPGLVARRAAEAALYLRVPKGGAHPMPQAVQAEAPLSQSNIIRGSTVTAVTTGMAAAAQLTQYFAEIRNDLGNLFPYVAMGVAFAAAIYVIYERYQQRKQGVA